MNVQINEAYFQRLLHQTDAIYAVATLSGFWAHRLKEDAAQFGISKPEWHVQLILTYAGEVLNGGHSQYLLNRGINHLPETLSALEDVSVLGCEKVIQSALDIATSDGKLDELSPSDLNDLHQLDVETWSKLAGVDSLLLAYLRDNEAQVLVQERTTQNHLSIAERDGNSGLGAAVRYACNGIHVKSRTPWWLSGLRDHWRYNIHQLLSNLFWISSNVLNAGKFR